MKRLITTLSVALVLNLFASDGNEISLHNSSTINVNYSDVQGGQAEIYDDGTGNTINTGFPI